MSSTSLTAHLTEITTACPYESATKHPFLTAAGEGILPLPRLALWLAQDRLYAAHGYPRFIGRLIAAIPYSSEHATTSKEEKQNARTLEVLVFCLQNVWLVMLTTPAARGSAVNYLARRFPKLDQIDDITTIVGRDVGLMIRAFSACLEDENLLVRRGALDLLVGNLKLSGGALKR